MAGVVKLKVRLVETPVVFTAEINGKPVLKKECGKSYREIDTTRIIMSNNLEKLLNEQYKDRNISWSLYYTVRSNA